METNGNKFDNLKISVDSISNNLKKEKASRENIKANTVKFGLSFLDCALAGLMPSDILLIGARTGQGKTTLVTQLAFSMANQGSRVVLFSLEAREFEIEQRLKYAAYCRYYYADPKREFTNLRFPNWLRGDLDGVFAKYDSLVDSELEKIKNVKVFYRSKQEFTVSYFEKIFTALDAETDVFIIDHLHYFDTDGVNENKEFTDIVKKIRDLALISNKAVILISHIRKKTNFADNTILPTIDDFHGSSNITKIATKVVTMCSYAAGDLPDIHKYGALMTVSKFREDGAATRYVALIHLDQKTGFYTDEFTLGNLTEKKGKFEFVKIEDRKLLPWWGRNS